MTATTLHVVQYALAVAVAATALRLVIVRRSMGDQRQVSIDLVFRDEVMLLVVISVIIPNTDRWTGLSSTATLGVMLRIAALAWYLLHVYRHERARLYREQMRLHIARVRSQRERRVR